MRRLAAFERQVDEEKDTAPVEITQDALAQHIGIHRGQIAATLFRLRGKGMVDVTIHRIPQLGHRRLRAYTLTDRGRQELQRLGVSPREDESVLGQEDEEPGEPQPPRRRRKAATEYETVLRRLDQIWNLLQQHTAALIDLRNRIPRAEPEEVEPGSVAGQVMMHIYRYSDQATATEAPFELSAQGVARAITISTTDAVGYLQRLERNGLVSRASRQITGPTTGMRRRFITWTVTERGRGWAFTHQRAAGRDAIEGRDVSEVMEDVRRCMAEGAETERDILECLAMHGWGDATVLMSEVEEPKGMCYPEAWRKVVKMPAMSKPMLAQGAILKTSHPSETRRILHAWVEFTNIDGEEALWEPERNEVWSREQWYSIFKPHGILKFTSEEATVLLLKTGHYGPWTEQERKSFASGGEPSYPPKALERMMPVVCVHKREKEDCEDCSPRELPAPVRDAVLEDEGEGYRVLVVRRK